jgi:GT2 family glycosyltransferase
MAAQHINAVRTYTVPPAWLLDCALEHGLWVMVGLPWEQHVAFLDDNRQVRSIEQRVSDGVRACAGHPAVLCYAIGNEVPAVIARWYGHRRLERFLKRLCRAARAADPGGLVTYVNYPTTEYLLLPFVDFLCFNVYLQEEHPFEAYLAHLQNLAGDRPLVLAEIGLDSRRNGEALQARLLERQLCTAFASGCAGVFVFSWTDEWHRGGADIDDWDFGLTTRDRWPKPALGAVRRLYAELPFPATAPSPSISVVVCSYNGSRTLDDCCQGLLALDYPNFEVIVVDDGSSDATPKIAGAYGFGVISTKNQGLSSARNVGLSAARGEIVAYTDDDARPDPHWLAYLADTFASTSHGGVGGPNITPPDDGPVAQCIGNSPGNPTHVLLSGDEAEHIPGCNMAFRRVALEEIGGFDPCFRAAGDDVDLCWRLQRSGWTLGYSPGAMVWHHRRNSIRAYWRQQRSYGRAEAMLEMKWPEKYNAFGHAIWRGRLYSHGLAQAQLFRRWRIYHGVWGSAPFQPILEATPNVLLALAAMPEWYVVVFALLGFSALGAIWSPLLLALPLLAIALALPVAQAVRAAFWATPPSGGRSPASRLWWRLVTAFLHLVQPLARLCGRLEHGLTPWRRLTYGFFSWPRPRTATLWSEHWRATGVWLTSVEAALRERGVAVARGNGYDRWDLELKAGMFGAIRVLMAIEEHGRGRQLLRFRLWPRLSVSGLILVLLFGLLAGAAALDRTWLASAILTLTALALTLRIFGDYVAATATCLSVVKAQGMEQA